MKQLRALVVCGLGVPFASALASPVAGQDTGAWIQTSALRIEMGATPDALWQFVPGPSAPPQAFAPPAFPLDGRQVTAVPVGLERVAAPSDVGAGLVEHRFRGVLRDDPSLALELRFRLSDRSPVVRFRYVLTATTPHAFSRPGGEDEIRYLASDFRGLPRATEVRLSEFVELFHGYTLAERPIPAASFDAGVGVMGPLLVASDGRRTVLLAYEHGSRAPDAFLRFDLGPDRSLRLRSVKGNYRRGQVLDPEHPFETVWLEAGLIAGDEQVAAEAYRRFVREELAAAASLAPRIQHDSRNLRQRERRLGGKRHRGPISAGIQAEIDVAHRMGIETFVLDGGWYDRAGDWEVSRARFPNGLGPLRRKLDGYGMQLGLWLDPGAASRTSRAYRANQGNVLSRTGRTPSGPVGEAGDGARMCIVSPWGDAFLKELVRLHRETGATCFRWAAADLYGCDAAGHGHGDATNTPEERRDACAFRLPLRLAELARRLGEEVPGAVVEFDVGGGGRAVGLAPLSAGRYLDFFRSGPPRSRITRSTYGYDRWIPSQLFVTRELPGDPAGSDLVDVASLVLGHDGIRGDLRSVPPAGVERVGRILGLWRQVRDSVVAASPVRSGALGGGGEVHEKIDPVTGRGVIVVFSTAAGRRRYVSQNTVVPASWSTPGTSVTFDGAGRAVLDLDFEKPGAAIVFLGARER